MEMLIEMLPIIASVWKVAQKALMAKGMTEAEADREIADMIDEASAADADLDQVQEKRRQWVRDRFA